MTDREPPANSDAGISSAGTIVRSAAVAFFAALAATMFFVLPAEYGIDPTGAGEKLGLLALADDQGADDGEAARETVTNVVGEYPGLPDSFDTYAPDVLGEPFSKGHANPYRSDELVIELDELEQVEYKAIMQQGDALVYTWSVEDGIVYTDFHADPGEGAEGYPEGYYIRYRETETGSDSGSLVAPFAGNHGWYWLNIEEQPIRITLKVSGYYESIDELFRSYQ